MGGVTGRGRRCRTGILSHIIARINRRGEHSTTPAGCKAGTGLSGNISQPGKSQTEGNTSEGRVTAGYNDVCVCGR